MFETKNLLMLVILSGGILAVLTGTMIQAAPVYAETEECEDNDDENCNTTKDRAQKITQENNCSADSGSANGGSADSGSANGGTGGNTGNDDNKFVCTNNLVEPNTGNDAFNGPTS
ncbi:MAG TPA: hypothetical protein VD710_04390 [Nitrososphaeraceae archaeon]|nr:hypothetical protein [Nitrososphaeraceae archaeon]